MGRTKKVTEDQEFDNETNWMDLDETKMNYDDDLFDDEDDYYVEPFGWED
jgi:hypothetical protein